MYSQYYTVDKSHAKCCQQNGSLRAWWHTSNRIAIREPITCGIILCSNRSAEGIVIRVENLQETSSYVIVVCALHARRIALSTEAPIIKLWNDSKPVLCACSCSYSCIIPKLSLWERLKTKLKN